MNLKGKIRIVERTDVGMVRDHNEDAIASNAHLGIAVLADGMGGLNAGEVASSMSVTVMMEELTAYLASPARSARRESEAAAPEGITPAGAALCRAAEQANRAVFHVSQTQPQCRGMGTTLVGLLLYDNRVSIVHVGDSRGYRFRDQKLEQITKDHSFVQELLDKGLFTKAEARASAQKNVVTRAVGIAPTVEVELDEYGVDAGDLYLICSDGLTDLVTDENIEASMRGFDDDLEGLADHLVNLANASGGNDNISIILLKALKPFSAEGSLVERIIDWFE